MPTVAGIGVTPLVQWLVVPLLLVALLKRGERRRESVRRQEER
jgi:hypothetical protein